MTTPPAGPASRRHRHYARYVVPVLAAVSLASVSCHIALSNQYMKDTTCTYLAVPPFLFALAYVGAASAVLAVGAHSRYRRSQLGAGSGPARGQAGWLCTASALVALCTGPVGAVEIILTHLQARDVAGRAGQNFCIGIPPLTSYEAPSRPGP